MTTEIKIELDRKHVVLRSQDRWAIQRLQPDGSYDTVEAWSGGRRSLFHKCQAHGIFPTREAEAALALLPEASGFRDR